jgi:tetratricopeptide (TPR) repeat protein
MAYVRKRGKQLVIVQGVREPNKGKVQQRILFTIFSKAEALRILGRENEGHDVQFQHLLEHQYPGIKLNWDKIYAGISEHLHVLPDLYQYKTTRLRNQFRKDLCSFARQLMLADPQDFVAAGNLIQEHRVELEYLADLIQWRLKLREQEPNQWNLDNPFYWRFTLQGAGVPPFIEEHVADFYYSGEYDRAKVLFRLLTECFDDYAEGYNYLGLISLHEEKLEEAMGHFQRVIETGRKSFPSRIPRNRYWKDMSTRPYMRGLMNLTLALNRAGRYPEALMICDRLEKECGEDISPISYRAMVYLNTGRWQEAADMALRLHKVDASESLVAAFALRELGDTEHALASFLHGAFYFPQAARILSGARMKSPKNHDEADDRNRGIEMSRDLAVYLRGRSRRSRRFFRRVLNEHEVKALLDEMEKVKERWHDQRRSGEREAFDRMRHMQAPEFAKQEARKLMGILR